LRQSSLLLAAKPASGDSNSAERSIETTKRFIRMIAL
jgi:hypothetical protein